MTSRRRAEIQQLLRHAIPTDPKQQTADDHIPSTHIQDTLDVAWQKLDDTAPSIHQTLTLSDQCALLRKLCLKIAVNHDVLPSSFYISGVVCMTAEPIDSGGFADIYNGEYKGFSVILKRPRISNEENKNKIRLEFCRESLLWSKLHHPHILPFLGISEDAFQRSICMVLPFMHRGNVRKRIQAKEPAELVLTEDNFKTRVDRWLYEVALGLAYLHGQGVVHGDLHGGNILIDESDHVRLTDFGFALIAAATPNAYGSKHGGSAHHFMAPELWEPGDFNLDKPRPSPACDVYAFGCTCVELYTGKVPFAEAKMTMYKISKRVLKGDRPKRPSTIFGSPMSDSLWAVVEAAWAHQPGERLTSDVLASQMERVIS